MLFIILSIFHLLETINPSLVFATTSTQPPQSRSCHQLFTSTSLDTWRLLFARELFANAPFGISNKMACGPRTLYALDAFLHAKAHSHYAQPPAVSTDFIERVLMPAVVDGGMPMSTFVDELNTTIFKYEKVWLSASAKILENLGNEQPFLGKSVAHFTPADIVPTSKELKIIYARPFYANGEPAPYKHVFFVAGQDSQRILLVDMTDHFIFGFIVLPMDGPSEIHLVVESFLLTGFKKYQPLGIISLRLL